jgi:hypothetical protein
LPIENQLAALHGGAPKILAKVDGSCGEKTANTRISEFGNRMHSDNARERKPKFFDWLGNWDIP